VVVLGCGKVGSAVAVLLRDAGLRIAAVTTRTAANAQRAQALTGAQASTDNAPAATKGEIVFVTANDDAIEGIAAEVADAGAFREGQLVVHMSGALPLGVLAPAAAAGAAIGCAHPMQSFATAEDAARKMPGSVFGTTAGAGAAERLEALVAVLGGTVARVGDENKTLYHAAAVMASNYLVSVEDSAARLLTGAGFDEATALAALGPLMAGTVDNIAAHGTTVALTGPIVRGDVQTVRGHVAALSELPGDALELYRVLGRHALEIVIRRETLPTEKVEALRAALASDGTIG